MSFWFQIKFVAEDSNQTHKRLIMHY